MEVKEPITRDYSLIGKESEMAVKSGLADANWYTTPVPKEQMRELLVRKNGPAIGDTLLWFVLILGSAYLVFLWWGSWLVIFPYIIYSVLYASTSDSRWHESGHGTAFKTDWMNNFLYEVSSFMVLRQSTVWRYSHTRHHSDTIIRGLDPEIAVTRPADILKILLIFVGISSSIPEFKKLFIHASGKIDPEVATYLPKHEYKTVIFKARIYLLIFMTVIVLSFYFKSILPLMYIGLPTLLGSWLMPVYGLTQHAGLAENVLDHRLNCRTVYMNRLHRYLYWNMNYHVEHHMFPLVPYHALPRLHELVKNDCPKPYNGIIETYKEIIPAILRQAKDPAYFVKRELPKNNSGIPEINKDIIFLTEENIKNGKLEICSKNQLERGEARRFDFLQKTYTIYRTEKDKIYVTDGLCTHGNAHLADGVIIGDLIECSKHNGRFDLTDGSPKRSPVCVGISTYPVEEINRFCFVDVSSLAGKNNSSREYKYKVVSNSNVATFIKELVLEPVENHHIVYKPGQYVHLEIPPHETYSTDFVIEKIYQKSWENIRVKANNKIILKRNYSFATNPAANDKLLKFNIRLSLPHDGSQHDAGLGSSYVFRLKAGDMVKFSGPFGDFLIKESQREMVYLGGGAGMAPLRSHLAYLFESVKTKRKISFWYGARSKQDIFYQDYFEKIEASFKNFKFHLALSELKPEDKWEGHTGMVHQVLYDNYLKTHPDVKSIEFYLCGPPALIHSGLDMLKSMGIQEKMIAFDEF